MFSWDPLFYYYRRPGSTSITLVHRFPTFLQPRTGLMSENVLTNRLFWIWSPRVPFTVMQEDLTSWAEYGGPFLNPPPPYFSSPSPPHQMQKVSASETSTTFNSIQASSNKPSYPKPSIHSSVINPLKLINTSTHTIIHPSSMHPLYLYIYTLIHLHRSIHQS